MEPNLLQIGINKYKTTFSSNFPIFLIGLSHFVSNKISKRPKHDNENNIFTKGSLDNKINKLDINIEGQTFQKLKSKCENK